MLTISIIVVVALAAFALMPAKPKPSTAAQPGGPQTVYVNAPDQPQVSYRQQKLREDADTFASAYMARANEAYVAEVVSGGIELLSSKPSA